VQTEEQRRVFGQRLKELRNQQRKTQKEGAALIGLLLSQYNKYEAGMHTPPADKFIQLASCSPPRLIICCLARLTSRHRLATRG